MPNPELFRLKNGEQLARQVTSVSNTLGEPITQPSTRDIVLGLSMNDIKQRFPERYRIYLDTLRRDKIGDPPHPLARTKVKTLNCVDDYIGTHYDRVASRTLFDSQMTVFEALRDFLEASGIEGYIKLPTAAGKTVLFTEFVEATGLHTLVVMPAKLLVDQTGDRFRQFATGVEVGKVYGGRKEYNKQVTLTTYDSFIKRTESGEIVPKDDELLILDEGHRALTKRRKNLVRLFDRAIKLGFTATPKYGPNRELKDLLGNEIHSMNIPEAVQLGLLAPFSVYLAEMDTDLSNIRVTAQGDYDEGDLERAININSRNLAAVDVYKQLFAGEKTIVYCVGIRHAEILARLFNQHGISADFVSGEQNRKEQQARLAKFKNGETDILCNANLLIEGFDERSAVVCLNLRPTLSAVVAEQRGGRVLRLDPANPNKHAIIVDFVGQDYEAGASAGNSPPITFAQIIDRAEVFLRNAQHGGGAHSGKGTVLYPAIQISGIKVVTNPEEVMRVTKEAVGITEAGWYSTDALSRRLRLPKEFILEFFKPLRTLHADFFVLRAYGDQQREYVSPEGLNILEKCFESGQGRKGVQEDEFAISFTEFTHFKGSRQRVKTVADSVVEELMKEDPTSIKIRFAASNPVMVANRARFIDLMRERGMDFRSQNQTAVRTSEKGTVIDPENEIALTQVFLSNKFVGDSRKIGSISNEVLNELTIEHPGSWREGVNIGGENRRGSGRRITILKKEFEPLYEQKMRTKGLELTNRSTPIDREVELGITNDYLNDTFVGGSAKNRPISEAVLAQIKQEHPEAWRQGITSTSNGKGGTRILGKKIVVLKNEFEDIYKRMMIERGAELQGSSMRAPVDPAQEIGITNRYNETFFIGNERTLRPVSMVILNEIAEAHPQAWRTIKTSGGSTIPVLKKEYEDLYKQLMQKRGIRLR